jgi:hypothetical protein
VSASVCGDLDHAGEGGESCGLLVPGQSGLETLNLREGVQVDHTLECQLLAHVMMNTGELRRVIKDINLDSGSALPESLKPVRNVFSMMSMRTSPTWLTVVGSLIPRRHSHV